MSSHLWTLYPLCMTFIDGLWGKFMVKKVQERGLRIYYTRRNELCPNRLIPLPQEGIPKSNSKSSSWTFFVWLFRTPLDTHLDMDVWIPWGIPLWVLFENPLEPHWVDSWGMDSMICSPVERFEFVGFGSYLISLLLFLIDYLEVVISEHTEPYTGNSMQRHLSPVTPETYPIRETSWTSSITSKFNK